MRPWITDAYEALLVLQSNPNSTEAIQTLDRVRTEFNGAASSLMAIREEQKIQFNALKASTQEEIVALRTKSRDFNEQVDSLSAQLRSLDISHTDAVTRVDSLHGEVAELTATLASSKEAEARYHAQLADFREQINNLQSSLKLSKTEAAHITPSRGPERTNQGPAIGANIKQERGDTLSHPVREFERTGSKSAIDAHIDRGGGGAISRPVVGSE